MIRPTLVIPPSDVGTEIYPAFTISLTGIKCLPTTPAACHVNPADFPSTILTWAQKSREVDKSVFGQVAKQLSCRYGYVFDAVKVPKILISRSYISFIMLGKYDFITQC